MEEANLKKFIIQRGLLKGTVTRIENFVNDPINLASSSIEMLQARKDKLIATLRSYESIQLDILSLNPQDNEKIEVLEEKYYTIISKIDAALKTLTDSETSNCPNIASSKLPNIEIPIFNGKDFTKYKPFMDLFSAVFDRNKALSDVQKLFYLRKYLCDEALAVIINLPIVNESYSKALELLKKRYENKSRLISNHINILLDIPSMQRGTAAAIRSFISGVQQQIFALKNLEQPIDKWDMLLISILCKKLDQYTNRAFQLDRNQDNLPTMAEFINFLEKRAIALEESGDKITHEGVSKKIFKSTNVAVNSNKQNKTCKFCEKTGHLLHGCPTFRMLSEEDRIKYVDTHELCTTCLNKHKGQCRFNFKCKHCKIGHNTLLHRSDYSKTNENVALHATGSFTHVLLPTIKVKLIDMQGREIFVRALLDTGSQLSFITTSLMKRLPVSPMTQNTNVVSIGKKTNKFDTVVNINIYSTVQNVQLKVKCHVVDSITVPLPQQHLNISNLKLPKNIQLSDSEFNTPSEISLLLNADVYFNIILNEKIKLYNGPVLQNTLFGYIVGGSFEISGESPSEPISKSHVVTNLAVCDLQRLEEVMNRFWLSEMVPEMPCKNSQCNFELQRSEECFQRSVRLEKNKFYVDLPLTCDLEQLQLGDSFSVALQRFLTLEKRFKKDPLYLEKYKFFIKDYIGLGHAKIVDIRDYNLPNDAVYFIAHHAVFNEQSKTTKIRVVFDGSMKSKSGISLNNVMLNGPVVQSELFDILIRFRMFIYILISDITKMFRAIHLNDHHKPLQNILWREDPKGPIICLQLQTVTYGLKASTFLATRCLIELSKQYGDTFPLAAQAMRENTYVDDILAGSNSLDQLKQLKFELIELLTKGNFTLHKWCSNVPHILDDLPNEQKYFEHIDMNKDSIVKTLGLQYNITADNFSFNCPTMDKNNLQTKRTILSYIGKMFDPLGLIGPIIVIAKIFMQQLWAIKIDWDSPVPPAQLQDWQEFLQGLQSMNTLSIPRGIYHHDMKFAELVGYADASQKAFGCCLYLRIVTNNGEVYVNLLCSKSRVAPLKKTLTIPKLELNSALLLAQLANKVHDILKDRFTFNVFLYSDSQIVLAWIKSAKIKNVYISNRIKQINSLTSEYKWSYVKSSDNPADLISRGQEPKKLQTNMLWWHGPPTLSDPLFTHTFENFELPVLPLDDDSVDQSNICTVNVQCDNFNFFEKYSDFTKMQRIVAFLLRFKNNALTKTNKVQGPLLPFELKNALYVIIRYSQRKHFHCEIDALLKGKPIKTGLANLHPFLDKNGILRVGGRLQNAKHISYEKMHPAILPKSSHITILLIRREHLRLLHASPKLLLSSLSQHFHIISGMRETKKVVHKCIKCFRLKAAAAKQLMGSLPEERITCARAFKTVGVDFCGPFNVKIARIRRPVISKAYVAVFVCFVTKAIHVELVTDLTTEAFLACLKRFIARRGMPSHIYCDNAATFKGASNQLKELFTLFNSKTAHNAINNYCLGLYIQFKFIPSNSPEFGGLWEAAVKSLKYHLKRIVFNLSLTFEGLYTVLTEIEAILNSRPLLPLSSDVSDFNYLTPGHFLIGGPITNYPEVDVTARNINSLKYWQILTRLKQDFWKAWSNDYLTLLQSRPKWQHAHPNMKVGDLVIVRSDNTAPFQWPMARIVKIFPGPDGNVRVAEVKIGNKTYTRSFRKLSPLPIN